MGTSAAPGWLSAPVWRGGLAVARLVRAVAPGLGAALAGLSVVSAVGQTLSIVLTGVVVGTIPDVIDEGIDSADGRRLIATVVVVSVLFLVSRIMVPFQSALAESLKRKVDRLLRERVMAAAAAPVTITHVEDPAFQDDVSLTRGVGPGRWTPGDAAVGVFDNFTTRLSVLGAVLLVAWFRWWLGLAFVVFGFLLRSRLVVEGSKRLRVLLGETQALRRSDYVRDLGLLPAVAKEIRVFGLAGWVRDVFSDLWLDVMRQLWRQRRRDAGLVLAFFLPVAATMGATLVLAGRAAIDRSIDVTQLVVIVQAVVFAGGWTVTNSDLLVEYGAAGIAPITAIEGRAVAEAARVRSGRDGPRHDASGLPQRVIALEGVAFKYPGRTEPVFTSLDLVLPAGRSVAVVGENGAGKTTLMKLLTRLLEPDTGRVVVDGMNLADIDPAAWRRRVAAIFQDFVRYELPAADNVGFGAVDRRGDRDLLARAARRAGVLDVIERLPAGWETTLSRQYSGGADLSGGQWQRVALARALMAVEAGAGVLILDEPTANLDVRAEAELFDRFIELTRGLTTVLVSHRYSSVRRADIIYVLDRGEVVEQGNHAELMARAGVYATTFNLQAERFRSAPEGGDLGEAETVETAEETAEEETAEETDPVA